MKRVVIITILLLLGCGAVSADLSDSLFCMVRKEEVIISLKQTPGYYKCKDTIASLEHLMIETAKDLMKIQTYLNRGRDVTYRQSIKTQKLDLIKKLQTSKAGIVASMDAFQSTIVDKSVKYFILKITPYKIKLQKSLVKIDALSGVATPGLTSYARLLQMQVDTIDAINNATTSEQLSKLMATYIYLKKEIAGKSE